MPPVQPFEYDVFISYSSKDRPWAKQLADDLTDRNFKVFFDRTNLDIGDPWEEQLDDSLDVSQHLVVLWSGNANNSKYVDYERTYFHVKATESRKELLILLEDPPPVVRNTLQVIPNLKEAGSYAKGVEQRDVNAWQSVVSQIDKNVRQQSGGLPVLVAILATTRQSMEDLDFNKTFPFISTMNDVIAGMGISSKEELLEYYGPTPNDWKPFGDKATILTVLDELKAPLAKATGNQFQIDWVPIGNDLWSTTDIAAAQHEATRLVKELSLVVIDPISLVDDAVLGALDRIRGTFNNAQSAVMVLTPFKMLPQNASIRNIVQSRANSFYSLFYQPAVPPSAPFANFGVNIGDGVDMSRLVLMTLGHHVIAQKSVNSFINP